MTGRSRRIVAALAVLHVFAGTSASQGARRAGARTTRRLAAAVSVVGGGPSLGFPHALAADPSGALFVADRGTQFAFWGWSSIVKIDPDGTRSIVSDPM